MIHKMVMKRDKDRGINEPTGVTACGLYTASMPKPHDATRYWIGVKCPDCRKKRRRRG